MLNPRSRSQSLEGYPGLLLCHCTSLGCGWCGGRRLFYINILQEPRRGQSPGMGMVSSAMETRARAYGAGSLRCWVQCWDGFGEAVSMALERSITAVLDLCFLMLGFPAGISDLWGRLLGLGLLIWS